MKTLNKRNKCIVSRKLIKTIILAKRTKEKVDLCGADLSGADLREAYLREADLSGADLRGADLSGAYLRGANLSGAYLRGANLSGAYLRGANLMGADLREADLSGDNLSGADNLYVFNAYDTSKRIVYCVKHTDTWYVKAGCFWGTIEELKDKVLSTHKSKVYLHNIALLEQL